MTNVNPASNTVDVYFAQNPTTIVKNIPLASQVRANQVMIGDRCRVDMFDESNPNDCVCAYIYGRKFPPTAIFANGEGVTSGTGSFSVPHGLGFTPSIYFLFGIIGGGTAEATFLDFTRGAGQADNLNLYAFAQQNGMHYQWFAAYFP